MPSTSRLAGAPLFGATLLLISMALWSPDPWGVTGSGLLSSASAQESGSALEQARELIFRARFTEAISEMESFLQQEGLSAIGRNEALEILATAQLANRRSSDAARTLARLYSRDPGYRVLDAQASPPVLGAFARARERHPDPIEVTLEHAPPRLSARAVPQFWVSIASGADAVEELQLIYRIDEESEARVIMARQSDGRFMARVPLVGGGEHTSSIRYRVVALAPSRTQLATSGSAETPLELEVPAAGPGTPQVTSVLDREPPPGLIGEPMSSQTPADQDSSVVEQWWFWTLVGVAVGGGALAATLVITQDTPPTGTLGSAQLMVLSF